ncbi:MAG: DUF411 domain-containing protein [Gemmatimonadota bacterium]|nr:DUF411 domain-containing protein [Gemmatimonadota bacterium]
MSHHRGAGAPAEPDRAPRAITRREWIARMAAIVGGAGVATGMLGGRLFAAHEAGASAVGPGARGTLATVYATESCGCCHAWMDHLRKNGFTVDARFVGDVTPYKTKYGVPQDLWSCHTARIGSYTIEGHVPAGVIRKLLAARSAVAGLAVPGMPIGSPGMEQPGFAPQPYDVVSFTRGGRTAVFARG